MTSRSEPVTAKKAAAMVRKHLAAAIKGSVTWPMANGESYKLTFGPDCGLRFAVRATPSGKVNVTIEDDGYVDRVTGGDREAFFPSEAGREVVEQVLDYERKVWGREMGDVAWGLVFISVRPTGSSAVKGGADDGIPC